MRLGVVRTQGDPFAIVDAAFDPNAIMPMLGEADADPMHIRPMFISQRKLRPRMLGGIWDTDNAQLSADILVKNEQVLSLFSGSNPIRVAENGFIIELISLLSSFFS